jgi:hypothetical protein
MNSAIVIIAVVILLIAIISQLLSLNEAFANAPPQSCGRQGDGPCPNGTKCVAGFCGETEERNVPVKETIIGHRDEEAQAVSEDDLDNPYSAY